MSKISRLDRGKIGQKNVLSLQPARDSARQPGGGSDGHVSFSESSSEAAEVSNQSLLERLEAENAELRARVVELLLQLQALHDGAG